MLEYILSPDWKANVEQSKQSDCVMQLACAEHLKTFFYSSVKINTFKICKYFKVSVLLYGSFYRVFLSSDLKSRGPTEAVQYNAPSLVGTAEFCIFLLFLFIRFLTHTSKFSSPFIKLLKTFSKYFTNIINPLYSNIRPPE